jgi:photosystem II stability/assembly factor-like uncharacterized protein
MKGRNMKSHRHWKTLAGLFVVCGILAVLTPKVGEAQQDYGQANQPIGYNDSFYSVSFVNTQKGWSCGYYGLMVHTEDGGKTWVRQNSGTRDALFGLDFVDENNGWAVGDFGKILYTADGGKTFTEQKSNFENQLFAVSFADAKNGWAVGMLSTILHTADGGKTWEKQGPEGDVAYNDVNFVDAQCGWIAGEFGTIMHTEDGGVTWEKQPVPLNEEYALWGIRFTDRNTGVAVGMDGVILITADGGKTWQACEGKGKDNFYGVAIKGNKAWACGLRGSYEMTNQGLCDWVEPPAGGLRMMLKYWYSDLDFVDDNNGWLVGAHGILWRTTDGGKSWQ